MSFKVWPEILKLRPEVADADGGIGDLQMSLHRAVYQTAKAPYQDVGYYGDITEPTPNLIGFFARIARRLSNSNEPIALYHLDQGMGGGKSHALVGLYHMASRPTEFFKTHVGREVLTEASAGGHDIHFENVRVVTLTADHFSPGKATETFGPAVNLFERFLWSLFKGDRISYDAAVAAGPNKATIQNALATVGKPVLILLDELMDYAMALSAADAIAMMPSEQAFLNALMDACDDVPRVAFVLVMIRSDLDQEGYTPSAESFREYLAARINRNGATIAVTETGDFSAIIRRRIFELTDYSTAAFELAASFIRTIEADAAWSTQVFERLGPGKGTASFKDRILETYPFHPDLMDLVRNEWGRTQGFQRVRSTVSIFALAAVHWSRAANVGDWVPSLIGVGDLPLGGINEAGKIPQARCLEALLNSGLLLGNDRAIQGYRAVATTDITSADGQSGQAVQIDKKLSALKVDVGQPNPAIRMATALFNYSLVGRAQGKRGATKPELLAALFVPANGMSSPFSSVEEVFTALTGSDGLGALETHQSAANQPTRYWLTIKMTLRMFFNAARNQIEDGQALDLVWDTARELAAKGQFDRICTIARPEQGKDFGAVAGGYDAQENRLFVLDPREWTLLNGEDNKSQADIRRMLGLGEDRLVVENAASCVIASVNTYQRRYAVQAAQDCLTWQVVSKQILEQEEVQEVANQLTSAKHKLKETVLKAYRHFAYLVRNDDQLEPCFAKLDDDKQSSLLGNDVWTALVMNNRAIGEYFDVAEKRRKRKPLSGQYLAILLRAYQRHLTLRDITASFYNNPRFPLVPSLDDIREAIFELIQPQSDWELVGPDGALVVDGAKQIAINSNQITLQPRQAKSQEPVVSTEERDKTFATSEAPGKTADGELTRGFSASPPHSPPAGATYQWYGLELTNRSIKDEAKRDEIQRHLRWLLSQLDNPALDHQLFTLKYELMAIKDEALADELRNRSTSIEAKATVRDEI